MAVYLIFIEVLSLDTILDRLIFMFLLSKLQSINKSMWFGNCNFFISKIT
ncbi:MAG: hypothetical protein WCG25_06825 [bacterium]